MNKKIIQNIVGFSAIVLLVLLIGFVFLKGEKKEAKTKTDTFSGSIVFAEDELVYDGSGTLDLMEGVEAQYSNGKDATEKVDAIITGDGTLNRKTVRYTFNDITGRTVTEKRTLVMKNYKGPDLYVENSLYLQAQDLQDMINVLRNKGQLSAEDGYGRDITSSVRILREKKADGQYEIEFSIVNPYQDTARLSVNAYIEGEVPDPEIRLSETEVTIRKTEYFDAKKYIVYSSDGFSENVSGKIQIDSSVNTEKSGDYRVIYKLYSADKTAVTTKVLKVKVEL